MDEELTNIPDSRLSNVASRTVGVTSPEMNWYVAVVLNNTEKASRNKLQDMHHEVYPPSKEVISVWKNGRKKKREQLMIPGVVFVCCTEKEMREIVDLPFVRYFLTDPSRKKGDSPRNPVATVPDAQIRQLQYMLSLEDNDVTLEPLDVAKGDQVEVERGHLRGLTGEICHCRGGRKVGVCLNDLGYACVTIDKTDLKITNPATPRPLKRPNQSLWLDRTPSRLLTPLKK